MTWTRRSARFALLGYLLVAGLVFGGLAWATVVSLRLERAEQGANAWRDHHQRLHLALSRLEARVQGTLIRETQRNAYEYAPYYYPPHVWDSRGLPIDPGDVIEVSPVVDSEFEQWLVLHFQVSPSQGWTSPQGSLEELAHLVDFELPARRSSQAATDVLDALRRSLAPDELERMLAAATARDLANVRWLAPEGTGGRAAGLADAPAGGGTGSELPVEHGGAVARQPVAPGGSGQDRPAPCTCGLCGRRASQSLRSGQAGESCDPLHVALFNLKQPPAADALDGEDGDTEDVSVTPSAMTAVWLHLGQRGERFLAYVRTVPIHGENVYQGFLLDWGLLRAELLAEIEDLFPEADLVPVESGPVDDPEPLLSMLPVWLHTSASDAPVVVGWTPMRSGLLLAWVAAVTVLAAVGLGVHSLLALTERRTQFAYAVSHELRTPLTTFRLYTDMLAGGLVPPESRDDYLATLNAESERLAQLVAGVLEYSRLEHHSVQLAPEELTVGEFLERARQRLGPRCSQAGRELVIEANGLADQRWRTDPDLALQIIGALVDNACKYAGEASDPRIILSASNGRAGRLRLEVRDFGPGISRKDRRRVFRPFRRGKDCAADAAGVGLGLALAHRWAGLLGGKLELVADRRHHTGARFCLSIPRMDDAVT